VIVDVPCVCAATGVGDGVVCLAALSDWDPCSPTGFKPSAYLTALHIRHRNSHLRFLSHCCVLTHESAQSHDTEPVLGAEPSVTGPAPAGPYTARRASDAMRILVLFAFSAFRGFSLVLLLYGFWLLRSVQLYTVPAAAQRTVQSVES
jgi:hypothetical protein